MISDPLSKEYDIFDHFYHALDGKEIFSRFFERELSQGRLLSSNKNHNYFGLGRYQI